MICISSTSSEAADALRALTREETDRWSEGSRARRAALLWELMTLCEAAGRLSAEVRGRLGDIPWQPLRAFHNRLVHGYFNLDLDTVREIVTEHVPVLAERVERELAETFPAIYDQFQQRRRDAGL